LRVAQTLRSCACAARNFSTDRACAEKSFRLHPPPPQRQADLSETIAALVRRFVEIAQKRLPMRAAAHE
jgi:hypothetical protein